jgi:hypothetical protein
MLSRFKPEQARGAKRRRGSTARALGHASTGVSGRVKCEIAACNHEGVRKMSKGMDSKKSEKKKPAKTMKEKKAAKEEKKRNAK